MDDDLCPNTLDPIDDCQCAECLEFDEMAAEADYYAEDC